jgi:endo-1,4-beta-xylanase
MNSTQESGRVPLRTLAEACGLPVGAAVDLAALEGEPDYSETLRREFNLCVAENVCKQYAVWKGPHEYDFTAPDRLAAFARENGMTMRGHTLVWHQAIPGWLREGDHAPNQVRGWLQDYIQAFVGRYKGRIAQWDVVNEAVADDGTGLRQDSFWYRALGPDYLKWVFQWAGEADPEARLYYNDYGAEDLSPKADAVYALASGLPAQGAPIHGIGLQCHFENGWRVTDDHRANVRRLAALGLDWQVTECDIRMRLDGRPPTPEQLADQVQGYADLIGLCLTEPRCRGFLVWGFTDRHSWIRGFRKGWGAALPFDEEYRPKPAYDAIAAALQAGKGEHA